MSVTECEFECVRECEFECETKFEVIVFVFTPKEFRHIAQGCSRSELPWGWSPNGACTPKGFRQPISTDDVTLSG